MGIIFGTAYASDDETSRPEESDDGDHGKAFDVSDDNGNDDDADDTHMSDDNDVTSLKERAGWDPNGLKESDSDSDIQNSVTTVQDDLGSSELQHCIGCSESEIDNVGPIGGDDGLAYLSPVYTPGSPAEEGVGGAVGGGESGRTGLSYAIPVPQPPVPIDSSYSHCIGCSGIDDFEDNTSAAGTAYASEEGNINDQASGTEEANDYAGADMEIVGESDADIGAYSDLSGDDVLKEDVQKSESTEDIWCIGCSETTDEATSNIAGDQQVAELPLGGVPLPTEEW